MSEYRPTIVLVHGVCANAGCGSKLIPLLMAKGLDVVATNCPLSSPAHHVVAVERVINMQDGPVLLVGHSWGGSIITEAGNNPKVSGLVYLAAAAPDSGQSFNEWWAVSPPAPGAPEIKPYGPGRYVAPAHVHQLCARTPAGRSPVAHPFQLEKGPSDPCPANCSSKVETS